MGTALATSADTTIAPTRKRRGRFAKGKSGSTQRYSVPRTGNQANFDELQTHLHGIGVPVTVNPSMILGTVDLWLRANGHQGIDY
jgi:hypothetical protein